MALPPTFHAERGAAIRICAPRARAMRTARGLRADRHRVAAGPMEDSV